MSTALVEPAYLGNSSQMWLPFSEVPEIPSAASETIGSPNSPCHSASQPSILSEVVTAEPVQTSETHHSRATAPQTGKPPRTGKPVKLGSLMLLLLKRYGITDEEIADGLESYMLENQTAVAS